MTPNIELTSKLNFAAWEGGFFTEGRGLGHSVLIASPTGEKLPVLYDRPAKAYQYLFVIDVGYLMAQVNLTETDGTVLATVSLSRVLTLSTETVQDRSLPKANTEVLFAHRASFSSRQELEDLDYFKSESVHKDQFKAFLLAAIRKAFVPRNSQALFWGLPRQS